MVAIPQLQQSCCGCTLETGSKIIAWLGLIGGVVLLLSGIGSFFVKDSQGVHHEFSIYIGVGAVIAAIIYLIFSILLLLGVYKKIPKYILIWVWVSTIGLCISCITVLYNTISIMISGAIGAGITTLITGLISLAISAYLLLVVYSYHRELTGALRQV